MGHRISRGDDGTIHVALPMREREMLRSLPQQLRPVLTGETDIAGARSRLFPIAYEDPEAEADYRELVGADPVEERTAALDAFAETLEQPSRQRFVWRVDLDEDQAAAWLSATNDARLVLASVIGITEEAQWDDGPEPGDAAGAALWYLGWLQEELLAALTGRDREDEA